MKDRIELGQEFYTLGLRLGALGTVAIGSGGGSLAKALARCAGTGAALAGSEVKFHDGSCAAAGVWLGGYYGLASTLFLRQTGDQVEAILRGRDGRPFTPEALESASPAATGEWDLMAGVDRAWASCQAIMGQSLGPAAVEGPLALTLTLERLGYEVIDSPQSSVPLFHCDPEGFSLTVTVGGMVFRPPGEDALAAAAAFASKSGVLPAFRPGMELF